MAKSDEDAQQGNGLDDAPAIGLISQYVKDLSFENPNAPAVFQWTDQPNIDVQFNITVNAIAEDAHELLLKIEVKATVGENTAFAVDLEYGALFGMRNVSEDQVHPFMFAEAPRLVFPFARRVLADAVRDGGFQPLLLDPIDFGGLYMQQMEAQQAEGAAGNA